MSGNYSRNAAVEVLEMDGETILLDQETFTVTKLNETGGFVWHSLSETRTFGELAAKMAGEFQAPQEEVEPDLEMFLRQLTEIGLIRREE